MDIRHKGSAELEREVEAQRSKVESTLGEIKERLTPGQLVDEMLSYTKHGGAHFAANLGHTVSANPLPAALLGVSLLWLMAGPKLAVNTGNSHHSGASDRNYRAIRGSGLQRVSHDIDESGLWYSEWTDDAGAKYRARSDKAGNRLGHFVDETGRQFAEFRDEAGTVLDQATGWANHAWHDVTEQVGHQVQHLAQSASQMGRDVQAEASRLTRSAAHLLEDQPLILGALAFAAGAGIGAALPSTRQEDELIGEASDEVRREAGHMAADLYERGKEQVADAYEDISAKAGELYEDAKSKLQGKPANGQSTQH